ncbi:MAG: hypothetical protein K0S54_2459 [Alphaproteobacteria bacterium]|nr:hypothetical protein [Alphaproteobacteria bacterium]
MPIRNRAMVLGLAALLQAPQALAQDNAACASMTGSWLATIENGSGAYASRAILTVHGDGTFSVVDSAQHQGVQGSAFSSQAGSWRCTAADKASGRTLNFGFPPRESLARSDWTLSHDGKSLSGTVALHIFAGVKDVDIARAESKPVDTFRFTTQRVSAP